MEEALLPVVGSMVAEEVEEGVCDRLLRLVTVEKRCDRFSESGAGMGGKGFEETMFCFVFRRLCSLFSFTLVARVLFSGALDEWIISVMSEMKKGCR